MGYISKYLSRDMEYQGPPSWASDTDQYEKAHTVGLKKTTQKALLWLSFEYIMCARMRLYRTMKLTLATEVHDSTSGRGGVFKLEERVQK